MKNIFITIIFLGSLLPVLNAQTVDPNFHIYVLAGQSNMAGRGKTDSISKVVNPRILMLDKSNNWVPATDPLHFDKPEIVGVGPGIFFAKKMLAGNDSIKIGLVPCAWGGSPIRVWEPDSAYLTGHPFDDAVKRTLIAMQSGVLKGILWHQGESDNNTQAAALYMNRFKTLLEKFRAAFHNITLPCVVGEIGRFNKNIVINKVLNRVPYVISNTAIVSSEGLKDKGDSLHFDTPSARELGYRYAIAMKRLLL
jgi:hypothetical protein